MTNQEIIAQLDQIAETYAKRNKLSSEQWKIDSAAREFEYAKTRFAEVSEEFEAYKSGKEVYFSFSSLNNDEYNEEYFDILKELTEQEKWLGDISEKAVKRKKALEAQTKLQRFCDEQYKKSVHKTPICTASTTKQPAVALVKPASGAKEAKEIQKWSIIGLSILLCLVASVLSSALNMLPFAGFFSFVFTLGLVISVCLWIFKGYYALKDVVDWYDANKKLETERKQWEDHYNETVSASENERFLKEFVKYDLGFREYAELCDKECVKLTESANKATDEDIKAQKKDQENKRKDIEKKMAEAVAKRKAAEANHAASVKQGEARKAQIEKEIEKLEAKLKGFNLLHSDYYSVAGATSKILSSGRADTFKEALNLALDEKRKTEEEEERQKEAMEQMRELKRQGLEAALREEKHNSAMQRVAEQQAMAQEEHNRAMEKAAQEQAWAEAAHNRAMEQAAKEQAEAASRQARVMKEEAERARRAELQAQSDGMRRCIHCANFAKCTDSARKHGSTCGAFRPN